eukprot:sb/3462019/
MVQLNGFPTFRLLRLSMIAEFLRNKAFLTQKSEVLNSELEQPRILREPTFVVEKTGESRIKQQQSTTEFHFHFHIHIFPFLTLLRPSQRSTPRDDSPLRDNIPDEESKESKELARWEMLPYSMGMARWEKIRKEELAREERRRAQLRAQLQRENELAEEAVQRQREQVSNGYVELVSSNILLPWVSDRLKKLKQAAEESRKASRPKLIKTRTRTESLNEPHQDVDIDIVGKGLGSGIDSNSLSKVSCISNALTTVLPCSEEEIRIGSGQCSDISFTITCCNVILLVPLVRLFLPAVRLRFCVDKVHTRVSNWDQDPMQSITTHAHIEQAQYLAILRLDIGLRYWQDIVGSLLPTCHKQSLCFTSDHSVYPFNLVYPNEHDMWAIAVLLYLAGTSALYPAGLSWFYHPCAVCLIFFIPYLPDCESLTSLLSGLSAATRMRFEKKKALYVERQSAEQRPPVYQNNDSPQKGKPVSAPVESRNNIKRSPRNKQERANGQTNRASGSMVTALPSPTDNDTDKQLPDFSNYRPINWQLPDKIYRCFTSPPSSNRLSSSMTRLYSSSPASSITQSPVSMATRSPIATRSPVSISTRSSSLPSSVITTPKLHYNSLYRRLDIESLQSNTVLVETLSRSYHRLATLDRFINHHQKRSNKTTPEPDGSELKSQSLAKKKLKQAAEESRKASRPKLIKTRTRTESLNEPHQDVDIDIVGKGLGSGMDSNSLSKVSLSEISSNRPSKQPIRTRYLGHVTGYQPIRAQYFIISGSLSDNSTASEEEDEDDEDSENGRSGYPVGSGLSAATRMRFEKKKALYVERQSAEQRPPVYQNNDSPQKGKPVSAPVESRNNIKRSPRNKQERA